MRMRHLFLSGMTLIVASTMTVPVATQKKATSKPGWADFRCDEGQSIPCGFADRVRGVDGDDYTGVGTPESGQGAHLTSGGELWIGLRNGLEAVLDLSEPDGAPPCGAACRFGGAQLAAPILTIPVGGFSSSGVYAEIQGNVVTASGDTTPTMLSMATDQTSNIRLNIGFRDAVMGLLWGFNFNASQYAGATDASVTRTNACTWTIGADGDSRAGLSAYGSDYGKGKSYRTNEGLYIAPFEFEFRVPSLCPP